MNIPNFLSILRILLVPVIVIFLLQAEYATALIVFTLAGITDALDGLLARILKKQTVLGAFLDPLADKVLLATGFISLSIFGMIPGWLTVIVISRDLLILLGIMTFWMMSVPYEIKPAFVSKITTTLQISTIFLALFLKTVTFPTVNYQELIQWLCWLTAVFTVISGGVYVYKGIKFISYAANHK